MNFPPLTAQSLAGQTYSLPGQLPAARTAVIVAFYQRHQQDVDAWIEPLVDSGIPATPRGLPDDAPQALIEIPMLKRRWAPVRGFIDGGMATGIGDADINARTWTCYTGVGGFLKSLGLVGDDTIVVLVVERDGSILDLERDRPDSKSLSRIVRALEN